MRNHLISIAIAAAVTGLAAGPAAAASEPRTATDQKGTSGPKKICRWIEARTGSQMRERVCLTSAQWKKVEEQLDW